MVKKTMVKEQLTSEMVESGKKLIEKLDNTHIGLRSAFWFYLEDSEKWRLMVSSPQTKVEGPKKMYQQIQKVIGDSDSEKTIDLKDISVVEEDHFLIELISSAIGKVQGISEIRYSRNTVNGHYIEDAFIYRLNSDI